MSNLNSFLLDKIDTLFVLISYKYKTFIMKPIHYVKKYELSKDDKFNHKEFVSDLTIDFLSLLEVGKARENIKGYENAVNAIRMKWDGIDKKTRGQLPEKLWGYFYATVIAKMREQLFPEIMQARKEKREEAKRRREEWKRFEQEQERDFFHFFFGQAFLSGIFQKSVAPKSSFQTLGLSVDAGVDEIKKAYKQLSLKHHPDHGGKQSKFVEITEAKNKCLAWAS